MIAIIDYGVGNVRSVFNMLDLLGHRPVVTRDPSAIADASHIILPGVGAFAEAMGNLERLELKGVLEREVLGQGKPCLGICLGMQLLARTGTERGVTSGLGWIDARVERLADAPGIQIPHMGWNAVERRRPHPVLDSFPAAPPPTFYYVHSYHMVCADPADVVATTRHGVEFVAAVARDNILGVQFHPEKSQDNGIRFYRDFLRWRS